MRWLLVLAFYSACCFADDEKKIQGVTWMAEQNGSVLVTANWCAMNIDREKVPECYESGKDLSTDSLRISERSKVAIKITNFNFVKYSLKVNIESKEVEAYNFVSGLWADVLGFDLVAIAGEAIGEATSSGASKAAGEWWKLIRETRAYLQSSLSEDYLSESYVTHDNLIELKRIVGDLGAIKQDLEKARDAAYTAADTVEDLQRYDIVDGDYKLLSSSLSTFLTLATETINGKNREVAKAGAGTVVEISLVPEFKEGYSGKAKLSSKDIRYFSHSKYPLMFHVGLSYADVDDIEYDKVRALDGRDLYSEVSGSGSKTDLAAFLSYPLVGDISSKANLYATLGTDFSNVGNNIYLGLSTIFSEKWTISVGGVYSEVSAADGEVIEDSSGNSSSRTLYEALKEEREWGAFLAIGVKLY